MSQNNLHAPTEILFSPGGSSYDLLENYQARGAYFYNLVQKIQED